jgi:hypothetical protein
MMPDKRAPVAQGSGVGAMDSANARERRVDAIAAAVVLLVAGVTWWEARRLPPAPFDPLGPGTVPLWLCYVLAGLALIVLGRLALGLRIGQSTTAMIMGVAGETPTDYTLRPGLAVFSFAWTVVYAAVLTFTPVTFLVATIVYMAALGWAMCDRSKRQTMIALAVAVIGGLAINTTFTKIFVVDLP